jgi:multicomponent Na+:H+ antiporter subunit C
VMPELSVVLVFIFLQFLIGLGCLAVKRDMVRLLIGIEILFNAANLCFVALSSYVTGYVDPFPQTIVMMAIVLDGSVIAVGLAIVINAYKHYGTLDIRRLMRLKW